MNKELQGLLEFMVKVPDKWFYFFIVCVLFYILIAIFTAHNDLVDVCNKLVIQEVENNKFWMQ